MRRVLIVFATREGQTRKIATRISEYFERAGIASHLVDASDSLAIRKIDLNDYDLLVFGASMHAGGLEKELLRFVNAHAGQIQMQKSSFFLVLLSAATKDPKIRAAALADAQRKIERQLSVQFDDTEMIAGALMYSKYVLPLKWLMKRIAEKAGEGTDISRDYEYTDWEQVEQYVERLRRKIE